MNNDEKLGFAMKLLEIREHVTQAINLSKPFAISVNEGMLSGEREKDEATTRFMSMTAALAVAAILLNDAGRAISKELGVEGTEKKEDSNEVFRS